MFFPAFSSISLKIGTRTQCWSRDDKIADAFYSTNATSKTCQISLDTWLPKSRRVKKLSSLTSFTSSLQVLEMDFYVQWWPRNNAKLRHHHPHTPESTSHKKKPPRRRGGISAPRGGYLTPWVMDIGHDFGHLDGYYNPNFDWVHDFEGKPRRSL